MAELNASTDNFIGLLLDVSGKARPADLQAFGPAEAADLLRVYAGKHPERRLAFEGDALLADAPPPVQAAPAADPVQAGGGFFEFGPDDAAPAPLGVSMPPVAGAAEGAAVATDAVAQAPAWMFEGEPSGAAPGLGDAPAPIPAAAPVPNDVPFGGADDFLDLPPLDGVADAAQATSPKVPVYWWIIAALFGLLGGLAGFFVLRKENPKGARTVLLVGLLAGLVVAVLAVALFFFGGMALLGVVGGAAGVAP